MRKVNLFGYYNRYNIGDDAILDVMRNENVGVNFITEPEESMKRLVIGGGQMFADPSMPLLRTGILNGPLVPKRMMGYALGFGPFYGQEMGSAKELGDYSWLPMFRGNMLDILNNMDVITVRGHVSKETAKNLGVKTRIKVTADPAFNLKPDSGKLGNIKKPIVGVSVRDNFSQCYPMSRERFYFWLESMASFIKKLSKVFTILMIPFNPSDVDVLNFLAYKSGGKAMYVPNANTPQRVLGLVGACDFMIGSRLHSLIFAANQKVPFMALDNHMKVFEFCEEIGLQEDRIVIDEAVIPHDRRPYITLFNELWERREETKNHLERIVPKLQDRELENIEVMRKWLRN